MVIWNDKLAEAIQYCHFFFFFFFHNIYNHSDYLFLINFQQYLLGQKRSSFFYETGF